MARLDSGARMDSGIRFDQIPITPKPKSTHKTMRIQLYFPVQIGNQIIWSRNFGIKLLIYATRLGLDPAEVAAVLLDVENAIYALESYHSAVATFPGAAYQRIDDALNNETLNGNIDWLTFAAPAPMPAAVSYGCLSRIFTFINDTVKKSAAYDEAIGMDLGTEPPKVAPPNPATTFPDFSLRTTAGNKAEIVWPKGVFDGVRLDFDLGAAGTKADISLRPNYTLNWLPPAGTSVIIKVRLLYIYKGEDFGNWSPWQSWTLTGV